VLILVLKHLQINKEVLEINKNLERKCNPEVNKPTSAFG
jgi:hypothetical protein